MLMLHGGCVNASTWASLVPELSQTYRVILVDLPGHSRTGEPDGWKASAVDMAGAVADAMETAGVVAAHVVGLSLGGTVAALLATRRPELARTLTVHEPSIFAGCTTGAAHQQLAQTLDTTWELFRACEYERAAELFMSVLGVDPAAWTFMPDELRQLILSNVPSFAKLRSDIRPIDCDIFAPPPDLDRCEVPALVTTGADSSEAVRSGTAAVADRLGNAELRTIAGDHLAPIMRASEYAPLIIEFTGRQATIDP
jgi:pimeloyl-ACP methyl ester carboxylesterase